MYRASGVITANTVTDIYYIARKSVGYEAARETVKNLMTLFDIAAVDGDICGSALYSRMDDFEDAVFAFAAEREGAHYIATRDAGLMDSQYCPAEVYTPAEVLKLIREN